MCENRIRREAKTAYDHFILNDLDVISDISKNKIKSVYQKEMKEVYQSYSWRIGNALIQPFHFIKVLRGKITGSSR